MILMRLQLLVGFLVVALGGIRIRHLLFAIGIFGIGILVVADLFFCVAARRPGRPDDMRREVG